MKFSIRDLRRQPAGQLVLTRAAGHVALAANGSARRLAVHWPQPERWQVPVCEVSAGKRVAL